MTIIDILNKWFKNEYNNKIINIANIIDIPTRDYFINEPDKLKQINTYKEKYHKILSQKVLNSKELSYDNLEKEIITIIDLILKIHLQKDLYTINNIYLEKINDKIYLIKLNLYISDLYNLETIILERLIALKELSNEDSILTSNKQMLDEYINNLTNNFYIFYTQIIAIEREIKAIVLSTQIILYSLSEDYELNKLKEKYTEVSKFANYYLPKYIINNLENNDYNLPIKISLYEIALEKYIYNNKELIQDINIKLDIISKTNITIDNRELLLKEISIIQDYYNMFEKYSRNIVTIANWKKLYKTKFNILTYDIYNMHISPFYEIYVKDENELLNYYDIIFDKISDILKDKFDYLKEYLKSDYKVAIELISSILKNNEKEFDYSRILRSIYPLTLILSFDSKECLKEFFMKYQVETNHLINKIENCLELEKYVPISTAFELFAPIYQKDNIYKLYKLYKKHKEPTDTYKLPSGIIAINSVNYIVVDNKIYNFVESFTYNQIRISSQEKHIICPKSLRYLNCNIFKGINHKSLTLNDGLEYLCNYTIDSSIEIPSSLSHIDDIKISSKFKTILFSDYKNSKLLNNYEELSKLIDVLFMAKLKENEKRIGYSKYDSIGLYKINDEFPIYRKCVYTTSLPKFSELILVNNDRRIVINANDLIINNIRFVNKTNENNIYKKNKMYEWSLNKDEIALTIDKLKEKIIELDNYELIIDKNEKSKVKTKGFHHYFSK